IVETGLRPGEKLYEELLIASRDIVKTENDQIFVEQQPAITPEEMAYNPEAPGEYQRVADYLFERVCRLGD
ncbi:MAG: polysaccharide biosynthesis protein, partial [Clostridia bacterium]|nr:polysaccharide biosynthesis protein [Clostridia bacterium]